jgi:hypothetical protein
MKKAMRGRERKGDEIISKFHSQTFVIFWFELKETKENN